MRGEMKLKEMTYAEKHKQINKEAKWTLALFILCFVWWCVTGWGLGTVKVYFLHLPLWFWLSVMGTYVIGCVCTIFLVKKVFVDFDLGDDENDAITYESDDKGGTAS